MQAKTAFKSKFWEEKTWSELTAGQKLTRVQSANVFSGELAGETTLEYLMFYREDGTCAFVGLEHFTGRLGEREGSFTLQHLGEWDGKSAKATWTVISGSGTGALRGLKGQAVFDASHQADYPMTLEYELE